MKRSRQSSEVEGADVKRLKLGENAFVSGLPSAIDIFQLNAHVLRKIFSYCSVADLCTLAETSEQFKSLIMDNGIIGGRMFDFGELSKCCLILDVFKVFGQQITHLKIGEKDVQYKKRADSKLDGILRLISAYCAIDTLKHLDLQYYSGTSIARRYTYAVLPMFRSIQSFSLNETYPSGNHVCADYFCIKGAYNRSIDKLVERIIGNAMNVSSIQLIRLKLSGRFFFADHIRHNLKSLSIVGCNIRVPDGLITYLESAPKLTSFYWKESSLIGKDTPTTHSSDILYELVAKNISDLENFNYFQNEIFMNEENRFDFVPYFSRPNHQLLRNFGKLKSLGLATMDTECLQLLAKMNQITELKANVPTWEDTNFDFLNTFISLKSVKFHTYQSGFPIHMNYLAKLPQLTKCHISVTAPFPAFDNVPVKAVESAKDLAILKISLSIGKLGIILYHKILSARLAHGDGLTPLTVQLSSSEKKRFIRRLGPAYRPDVVQIHSNGFK